MNVKDGCQMPDGGAPLICGRIKPPNCHTPNLDLGVLSASCRIIEASGVRPGAGDSKNLNLTPATAPPQRG